MFKDPRMDMAFIRTWGTMEEHCAKVAMNRAEEIIRLDDENQRLRKALHSSLSDLHGKCSVCAHYTANHNEGPCRFCCYEEAREPDVEVNDNWEWRYKEMYGL